MCKNVQKCTKCKLEISHRETHAAISWKRSDFQKFLLVSWKPQSDDKTPGSHSTYYLLKMAELTLKCLTFPCVK